MLVLWRRLSCPCPGGQALHEAGRDLLRQGLALTGFAGAEGRIVLAPSGKPMIPGGPEFSVSHAGNAAVCAVDSAPVGIDIEPVTDIPEGLLDSLTPSERAYTLAREGQEARRFFRLWTMKESVVKARGEGLGGLLALPSLVTDSMELVRWVDGLVVRPLALPIPGACAALCSTEDLPPEIREG